MKVSFSVSDLAVIVQPRETRGSTDVVVRRIASLETAQSGDLSFLGNVKYRSAVADSAASVILLPLDYVGTPKPDQVFLLVENPSAALALVCARVEQALWPKPAPGIHPTASIAPGATISPTATIGPLCVVEQDAVIGAGTHLQAHVFVGRAARIGDACWLMPGSIVAAECVLGQRVQHQPGAESGADGFGYEFAEGRHQEVPQVGQVVVHDDVEIGANTTIDRARFSQTVIGQGTKIDNLVQIAHNVVVGRHCMICSQVGISGSTTLEDYVVLGGQVGTVGHITIGKGVKAGGKTGINTDVPAGAFINGNPHMPYMLERRIAILTRRLPELFQKVEALEAQLKKSFA